MAATDSSSSGGAGGFLASLIPSAPLESLQNLSLPPKSTLLAWGAAAVAGYCVYEQLRFAWWRRQKDGSVLPGPDMVPPLVGGLPEMVKDPHGFWEKQRKYSCPGMSWQSILGTFTIFVTEPQLVRHVFSHNSKDTLILALHPNAVKVLGKENIAFMHGPSHKALRKSFLALFTRKALSTYVTKQDEIICQHLRNWIDGGVVTADKATEIRPYVRDLNAWTSQEVFAGPYLDDEETRRKFSDAYKAMTDAFLAAPIFFPGTGLWAGYQGRKYIVKTLSKAAARSKARMAAGHEPVCLLDFWSQGILEELEQAKQDGVPPPPYAEDYKMAYTVMDFLFASQDASTASLVWTLTLMADHPDVLARVREEQVRVRSNLEAPITGEMLDQMKYTKQVVKEILRYRPPAPMVIQRAQQPFVINENYTAPKGALIAPSIVAACHQGYENPDKFDPDRFGPERREDTKFAANFMVFGYGPHYCVGKEYAMNHLTAFLARIATSIDHKRLRSKDSDYILYLPTIYPGNSVFTMKWSSDAARTAVYHQAAPNGTVLTQ